MPKNSFKDKPVYPGDKLSVIEVLGDGAGAYQKDGDVRSAELGTAKFDMKTRKVSVEKKTPELILPHKGSVVLAEAGSVMRRDARVDVFNVDGHFLHVSSSGVLHVSDAGREFVRDLSMAVRNGDIIKAEVINVENRFLQLSIQGSEYGVVYAYCSRCGGVLEMQGNRLNCPKCDRGERRKTARTYGKEELQ